MHAIRMHSFGPPDVLVLDELPDLEPGPGQVRIAVAASGVHLLDTTIRRGEPGPLPAPELPTIPGREVAGVVDALGDGVEPTWLGRRVAAHLGMVPGGYAEQAVAAVGLLFPVPDHVTFPAAVAAIGTGRTAQGVVELEPAGPDDTVLVLSAAGGLGWLLVQDARARGARVVAAARGDRGDRLAEIAPDLVVDYGRDDWAEQVEGGVTVVYDGVGGAIGRTALELLRPGGRLVMFGFSAGSPTAFDSGDLVRLGVSAGWSLGARMQALPGGIPGLATRALDRVAAGEWRPLVTAYPLAEAARAHADLEGRRALGKVVLEPR
ncbi:zinc-binding dehydrogenase [Nocardioides sp. MAH-18]|uniref:Zinc-binding dehydrogenase n=1 Tax=Nocardioides agri TaxID=2682843 RepID=A0A6L6XWA0_9ACTN|nr:MULTISPECIES: zinc-binding dehydrogenase [unclassified Nocardioides]MBA2954951.1 zinc-binding dehydrogenase [Nocardioides sp. CGMCC 1.13656]MVQ49805.1 zinc-binding dehydrogenase [Nocardioides sp. MAH-18]